MRVRARAYVCVCIYIYIYMCVSVCVDDGSEVSVQRGCRSNFTIAGRKLFVELIEIQGAKVVYRFAHV